jgi:unsaturated rhamnogalacturonyl hydrolase
MTETLKGRKAEPGQEEYSTRMSESTIARWDPTRVNWHYEDGFLLMALHRIGEETGKAGLLKFVRDSVDNLVGPGGRISTYRMEEFNLDMINPGKVVLLLSQSTGEKRYHKALMLLREQLRRQPRCPSGGFWHKKIYPDQMWLDGLYMAGPFYAGCATAFAEPEPFADVTHQFILMEERARDPRTGLLYHAWDESRRQLWANPENGRSPCFWARAMGWYAMALVDVLDILPAGGAERVPFIAILTRLLSAIARFQDQKSGLWCQVVDQAERDGNYPEASASCMFVYSILKARRLGYLRDDALREAARRGYRGICERFLDADQDGSLNLDGTCGSAGLGGNPYRDGSYAYYIGEKIVRNDHKGVAAFILASREMELDAKTRG